eukprot:6210900-Pleurochrysis_carterae.AAC.3
MPPCDGRTPPSTPPHPTPPSSPPCQLAVTAPSSHTPSTPLYPEPHRSACPAFAFSSVCRRPPQRARAPKRAAADTARRLPSPRLPDAAPAVHARTRLCHRRRRAATRGRDPGMERRLRRRHPRLPRRSQGYLRYVPTRDTCRARPQGLRAPPRVEQRRRALCLQCMQNHVTRAGWSCVDVCPRA